MALIKHLFNVVLELDLPGHVTDTVRPCHQLRPSQVDTDYAKFDAVSTVRKSERRGL
jgi:hypothetical protein